MELAQVNPTKGQLCVGCPRYNDARCGSGAKGGHVDVLFVAEQPDEASARSGVPFQGHGGKIVRSALRYLQDSNPAYRNISVEFTYAVQCQSPTDTAPGKEVMHQCLPYLQSAIKQYSPKVIVALGATALRQLGTKQKYNEVRNKFIDHYAYAAPIYTSFSEKALLAAPGVFETFKLNLTNIFERVLNKTPAKVSLEELSKDYRLPKTMDEALAACDEIINYVGKGTKTVDDWHISVDTETTTLYPEKDGAKIIAFCFGYDVGRAATILFDHPGASPEYLARLPELKERIAKLLACRKPKVLHNAKFDLKFIELKYGMPVSDVVWDTLLGEHLLDEDKKGNYGLKILTANLLPKYCGYEDKLHDLLEDSEHVSKSDEVEKEIEDQRQILAESHPEFLQALEAYKKDITQYESDKQVYDTAVAAYERALDEYYFKKSHLDGLQASWEAEVADWPKGKRGRPKKPVKWFSKPEKPERLREPKKPEDPRSKTEKRISQDAGYENLPIHDLQVYGAIDGDVTRQLGDLQRVRIIREKSKVVPLMRTHGIPASRVLGRMEYGGTRVDQHYIGVLEEALSVVVQETERELYGMVGRTTPSGKELNLNHAGTLANVLYNWGWTHPNGNKMGVYDIRARTKKDQPSTSEKILRQFVAYEDQAKTVPTESAYFIERLLKYRKASKALNTFLANIRALSKRDGFLHTQFHLNGTGTGRLSCVAATTQLVTTRGTFEIADPELREEMTLNPVLILTHKNRLRRIQKVFRKGRDEMYRVTAETGHTLDCTMDHRFLTPKGWKQLRELRVNSTVHIQLPKTVECVRIESIHILGVQDVWDLSVEEDESYVSQGFISHNSSDMNMQNVPKFLAGWNIKKLFVPDDDSYVIVNVDYKGAEVRVFTAYARDEALIAALNDGLDMHSFFAHKVFKRPYEMYARRDDETYVTDKQLRKLLDTERSNIKRVVFGILYGAGPEKIAETIGIDVEEAKLLIALLYEMFPEIALYAGRVESEVEANHFVDTLFGRRRRFPLAGIRRHAGRAKRQARNFKIQSTSSDIVIGQLVEMDEPLRRDIGGRMLLTVHDSLVFQWPKRYLSQLSGFVQHYAEDRVRQKYAWLPVPFKADVEIGDNYGECQSIEKYIAKHPLLLQQEGIVEENELLTELRIDAFEAA